MKKDFLLSDEFAEFSEKINVLREHKKEIVAEFKRIYENHKIDLKLIEEKVAELQKEYLVVESLSDSDSKHEEN